MNISKANRNIKILVLAGVGVVSLAVLATIIPLFWENKAVRKPQTNLSSGELQQQRIRKEFEKLEAMRKSQNADAPSPEEIQKEFDKLESERKNSKTSVPNQEDIQKEFEALEKMRK